jgi:hypothetical protein
VVDGRGTIKISVKVLQDLELGALRILPQQCIQPFQFGRRPPQEPTAPRFMEHHGELAPRH